MEEVTINISNINKKYDKKIIFDDLSIEFFKNKVNAIVGKSGCGKSTLLNIVSGVIKNDGIDINQLKKLGISYIFQEDRLIEWLTVEENIKLVCSKKYIKEELDFMCDKYLDIVGIGEFKKYYPQMLSGGLRQRVNIARGMMFPSQVIIMDEPFKSIDIKNKQAIIDSIKKIQKEEGRTIILVTHDIDEALYLADKIYVLADYPTSVKEVLDNNRENMKDYLISLI
ncbi:MAG: ABC transporter ATP-binding protein [Romboutsia sp.]|uniref:ABC transporter ATP-binding protein n=1 Tax=Romboutsia sp. TaxID=1965302 RepID=UPI003F2CC914